MRFVALSAFVEQVGALYGLIKEIDEEGTPPHINVVWQQCNDGGQLCVEREDGLSWCHLVV